MEFAKTFIKMLAVAFMVTFYLRGKFDEIIGLTRSSPVAMAGMMMEVLVDLLIVICALAILVGIADLLWQKFNHQKKLRMSFQDLKDEAKRPRVIPTPRPSAVSAGAILPPTGCCWRFLKPT